MSSERDKANDNSVTGAEAIVQLLKVEKTVNKTFSITSKEGDGPGQDQKKWRALLEGIQWSGNM